MCIEALDVVARQRQRFFADRCGAYIEDVADMDEGVATLCIRGFFAIEEQPSRGISPEQVVFFVGFEIGVSVQREVEDGSSHYRCQQPPSRGAIMRR